MASENKFTKCAVVGANGFLGQYIVKKLINRGHVVYGIYHHSDDGIDERCIKVHIIEFMKGKEELDAIFFAAGNFFSSHQNLVEINCDLISRIVKTFPNSRIIYISSTSVYGAQSTVINEQTAFANPGIYGRAKLAGEFITSAAASFAIVRLAYLYGYGLNNGSFLPGILKKALLTGIITIHGEGKREQDYLHVEDAAELCLKAMYCGLNEVFLGATGKSYSNLQVAEIIGACISGCKIEFSGVDNGISFYFDPSITVTRAGWTPQIVFSSGIKTMIP